MTDGILWMMAGIVLCGFELLVPGVFLLWIGLAAIAGGGATQKFDLGFPWQVGAFLICLVGCLSVPILRRGRQPGTDGGVNAPSSGLVGKPCRALAFDGAEGRVSFRDGTWQARMAAGESPLPGTTLWVIGLDGTTLVVVAREAATDRAGVALDC